MIRRTITVTVLMECEVDGRWTPTRRGEVDKAIEQAIERDLGWNLQRDPDDYGSGHEPVKFTVLDSREVHDQAGGGD